MMTRILLYEPNTSLCAAMKECLERDHLWVVCSSDPEVAQGLLAKQYFHLCLWSVTGQSAVDQIYKLRQERPFTSVVGVAPSAKSALIVAVMRAGATNFWHADDKLTGFMDVVKETLARVVPQEIKEDDFEVQVPEFVGRHPRMLEIFQLIMSIRNSDSTVLITGESGTGKEVVARAIHNLSPRRRQAWVAVNCGAIPNNLLESELFGHVKGAFTGATQNRVGRFQLAGSGTLFLDEISDLSLDLQAKILRAIQNKVFEPVGSPHSIQLEARIIAATNQDLETAVAEKRFREDLFYRLNVIPIFIPPLRTRKSDIPLLVGRFLEKFCRANQKGFTGISEEAMQCLMQYYWPGNVRELENLIERVVVLKRDTGIIELKDLPIQHLKKIRLDRFVASVALPEDGLDFNEAVNEFENELILQALQKLTETRIRQRLSLISIGQRWLKN